MDNNIVYIIGIPTKEKYINSQLTSFMNDGIPTLYLYHKNILQDNGEYNFLLENNFSRNSLENVTQEYITENIKVICGMNNIYSNNTNSKGFARNTAQNFIDSIIEIKNRFPTIRIAYVTLGSPTLHDLWIPIALNISAPFSLNIIDTEYTDNAGLNKFNQVAIILSGETANEMIGLCDKPQPYDRSGLFFANPSPTIPSDIHTDKTFTQIVDETALTYAGKNPIVAWSGGIDSTTVVASFIKNNIPFRVTINSKAQTENPDLYDYLVANHNTITIPNNNNLSNFQEEGIVVTGECADQLYPGIRTNLIPNVPNWRQIVMEGSIDNHSDMLMSDVDTQYLYDNVRESFTTRHSNNFKCNVTKSQELYDNYLLPIINTFPVTINHFYELKFFYKFIFKYQDCIRDNFVNGTGIKNEVVAFFNTDDFQRWALTNMDYNFENYSTNYTKYKTPNREYNHSVLQLDSLLNQTKYPSL
jgi:hypothetical protein